MKTRTNALALGACLLAGAALAGDDKSATAERSATDERNATFTMAVPAPMGAHGGGFMIHHALEGFEAKVVKGAPYSADAVTEMTQALADGNKISRTTR